jgi:hypothetical protein
MPHLPEESLDGTIMRRISTITTLGVIQEDSVQDAKMVRKGGFRILTS